MLATRIRVLQNSLKESQKSKQNKYGYIVILSEKGLELCDSAINTGYRYTTEEVPELLVLWFSGFRPGSLQNFIGGGGGGGGVRGRGGRGMVTSPPPPPPPPNPSPPPPPLPSLQNPVSAPDFNHLPVLLFSKKSVNFWPRLGF